MHTHSHTQRNTIVLNPSPPSYSSGRKAVSMSRPGDGRRGLYTLVFDDSEEQPLLAYFAPSRKACCYHRSGSIHLLSNEEGGSLFDEVRQTAHTHEYWCALHKMLMQQISVGLRGFTHICGIKGVYTCRSWLSHCRMAVLCGGGRGLRPVTSCRWPSLCRSAAGLAAMYM